MSFYDSIDLSSFSDDDPEAFERLKAFEREWEIDELVIDLMNHIKNMDYCHEGLRNRYRDH